MSGRDTSKHRFRCPPRFPPSPRTVFSKTGKCHCRQQGGEVVVERIGLCGHSSWHPDTIFCYRMSLHLPGWRNGIRCALKMRCPKGLAGSSPAPGTIQCCRFTCRSLSGCQDPGALRKLGILARWLHPMASHQCLSAERSAGASKSLSSTTPKASIAVTSAFRPRLSFDDAGGSAIVTLFVNSRTIETIRMSADVRDAGVLGRAQLPRRGGFHTRHPTFQTRRF